MSIQTALTKQLRMSYPIIQAPLAGGGDTPALVAAVCEAGGLGFIGAAYLTVMISRRWPFGSSK
jgi:nitronate monooxygenase